jgi:phosphoglycerate dehydrogenase-like enzyme
VVHTAYFSSPTIELTLALPLACARNIPQEHNNVQQGRWQTTIGADLKAATLGVIGLSNVGAEVARIAIAMGMKVIAWSQNLSPAVAASQGGIAVSREALFERSDFISVHVQLSERTKGLVGRDEFLKMKPTARLITTPHIGYVSRDLYVRFYRDTVANLESWLQPLKRGCLTATAGPAWPPPSPQAHRFAPNGRLR